MIPKKKGYPAISDQENLSWNNSEIRHTSITLGGCRESEKWKSESIAIVEISLLSTMLCYCVWNRMNNFLRKYKCISSNIKCKYFFKTYSKRRTLTIKEIEFVVQNVVTYTNKNISVSPNSIKCLRNRYPYQVNNKAIEF